MKEIDVLQRFMFEHASIRGDMVHLDAVYKTILQQHPYPHMVQQLLGQALVSCLLLTASIKFEGEISLQFQGDVRLPLLLVQCDHQLQIRGFAKYQSNEHVLDYNDAFLKGKMVVTINQYNQTRVYQSVIPILSLNMADNLMHYFAQSEQITSRVWLAVEGEIASGMLIQLMPDQNTQQREEFWEYAVQIGETLKDEELLRLDNATILHRLYHETEIRLYAARPVRFCCRCNDEKMKQVLRVLGETETNQLLQEQGVLEVVCDFCNKRFTFDSIDVAMLFR